MTWEPFESIPVMEGYGYFAKGLEYGSSKAVGAELGMFMTTKQAVDSKRAALERCVVVVEVLGSLVANNKLGAHKAIIDKPVSF